MPAALPAAGVGTADGAAAVGCGDGERGGDGPQQGGGDGGDSGGGGGEEMAPQRREVMGALARRRL